MDVDLDTIVADAVYLPIPVYHIVANPDAGNGAKGLIAHVGNVAAAHGYDLAGGLEDERLGVLEPEHLWDFLFVVRLSELVLCLHLAVHVAQVLHAVALADVHRLLPRAAAAAGSRGGDDVLSLLDVIGIHAIDARLEAGDSLQSLAALEVIPVHMAVGGIVLRVLVGVGAEDVVLVAPAAHDVGGVRVASCEAEEEEVGGASVPAHAEACIGRITVARGEVVAADGGTEGAVVLVEALGIHRGCGISGSHIVATEAASEDERQLVVWQAHGVAALAHLEILSAMQAVPLFQGSIEAVVERRAVAVAVVLRHLGIEVAEHITAAGAQLVAEFFGHVVGGHIVLHQVLEGKVVAGVVAVADVDGRHGTGLAVLVVGGDAAHRAAYCGQRVLGMVRVVVVPGVPYAIHLVAQLEERLVALALLGIHLEELAVHNRSVVVEDEALGTELHGHIVEGVLTDLAVADEHPLAEVGQVEVRVDESVGFIGRLVLGVLEDDVLICRFLRCIVVLIEQAWDAVHAGADEGLRVGQQLLVVVVRHLAPRVGVLLAINTHVVRQRGHRDIHQGKRAVALRHVLVDVFTPSHPGSGLFPVNLLGFVVVGIEETQAIMLLVEVVVRLATGCRGELREGGEGSGGLQVDAVAVVRGAVSGGARLSERVARGRISFEHPLHLACRQVGADVAVEGDGGMHDVVEVRLRLAFATLVAHAGTII